MRRLMLSLLLMVPLFIFAPMTRSASDLKQLLSSDDGLISMRVPEGWYLSTESSDTRVLLIAAPDAERAADWQAEGEPLFHLYVDTIPDGELNSLLQSTLKTYGFGGITAEETPVHLMGLTGTQFDGQIDSRQIRLVITNFNDQWIRFVAVGDKSSWNSSFVDEVQASIVILPQIAVTPRGWSASIRAPQGWEESGFSSFVQWKAPADGVFAGMEVWFQAGLRADLVGNGEPVFVLQSLGIMYATQVDQNTAESGYLGGLSATRVQFESFTHVGVAINVENPDFGTANLVARAPLGTWTPVHDALVEAMVASVQISPPTADAAPVGLRTGYRAPNFVGSIMDGSTFALADYAGQLVFVHFWFVNCPYCQEEWPHVQAVYSEYRNEGMVVLAINAIDSPDAIERYFASSGLDVPVVLDDGTLHELFNVSAFPTTFVMGPDGIIVSVARGPMSENNMRYLVEQYLLDD